MELVIKIDDKLYNRIKYLEPKADTMLDKLMRCVQNGTPLPKCNECKYYEGVHKVQGHAPCSYHTIGGVMWDWNCSQFEADKESDSG